MQSSPKRQAISIEESFIEAFNRFTRHDRYLYRRKVFELKYRQGETLTVDMCYSISRECIYFTASNNAMDLMQALDYHKTHILSFRHVHSIILSSAVVTKESYPSWFVLSDSAIYGRIDASIDVDYASDGNDYFRHQVYQTSFSTVTETTFTYQELMDRILVSDDASRFHSILKEETTDSYVFCEVYDENEQVLMKLDNCIVEQFHDYLVTEVCFKIRAVPERWTEPLI
jgi:hypothetical protein